MKRIFKFSTQRHLNFVQHKQRMLQQIKSLKYVSKKQLRPIQIPITNIVPHFFTNSLHFFENPKIHTQGFQNTPSNSFLQLQLKLNQDLRLQSTLRRLSENHIRIGRLLELMDSMAGLASYRHCERILQEQLTIVTGCVDSLLVYDNIAVNQNILIESNLNYVGKTTLEAEVNIIQKQKIQASAFFTMVTRKSKGENKGVQVPKLVFDQQDDVQKCQLRFKRGEKHKNLRTQQLNNSLNKSVPTNQQVGILHHFFIKNSSSKYVLKNPISSTKSSKEILMHSQDRNVHGKIFGGFIMRELVESAWLSALKLTKGQRLQYEHIQDIYFLAPVEVGDGLIIESKVVYTEGNFMVVKVDSIKLKLETQTKVKSSELFIIFSTRETVPEVQPFTYEEGIEYLMGKRKFDHIFV